MTRRSRSRLLLPPVLVLLLAGCTREPPELIKAENPYQAPLDAPRWPRFHGPDGRNISPDVGLLRQWPDSGPPLDWTAEGIGHGFAGVTTANGLLYTAGNIGGYTVVSAIHWDDGRLRWQTDNGGAWEKAYEGTRGTPTIDGDRVYHQSPLGQVVCLDAYTGEKRWTWNVLEAVQGQNIQWALAESLLVDGDRVICCPGGRQASVVALDKHTGQTVWMAQATGDAAGYASPTLAEYEGLRIILTMTAKALIGVNADTGQLLFRHPFSTDYDVNALQPVYHEGRILISSGYGAGTQSLKLNVDGDQAAVEVQWQSEQLDNHHGGVVLWDGFVYGAAHTSNRGNWICLDWDNGQMKYAERGVGKGSVVLAEGMLYTLSENRLMGLVPATPDGHQLVSRFRIPSGGQGPTWAHPVVIGGRLYIRHGDRLFAYNVRAG